MSHVTRKKDKKSILSDRYRFFEKQNRCASMGWQGVLNKKTSKKVSIYEVFDELCSVTGDKQESLKKNPKNR